MPTTLKEAFVTRGRIKQEVNRLCQWDDYIGAAWQKVKGLTSSF